MSQSVRTRPEGSGRALSEAYDTALLDLDGVVYAGGEAIAHAVDSLATAREGGMRLAYVTNNALRTPDAVVTTSPSWAYRPVSTTSSPPRRPSPG